MGQTTARWHSEVWRFHDVAVDAAVAAWRQGKTEREQTRAAAEALWKLRGQTPPEGWDKMDGETPPAKKEVLHEAQGIESPNDPPLPQEAPVDGARGEPDSEAGHDDDSPPDAPQIDDENAEMVFKYRYRRWLLARCRRDATAGGYGRQFDGMSESELEDVAALEGMARMDFAVWETIRFSDE